MQPERNYIPAVLTLTSQVLPTVSLLHQAQLLASCQAGPVAHLRKFLKVGTLSPSLPARCKDSSWLAVRPWRADKSVLVSQQ